jgi:hypothetical protein
MRTVKVKIVEHDIEFEMEVPDHWEEKEILRMAQVNAKNHVLDMMPQVTIEL